MLFFWDKRKNYFKEIFVDKKILYNFESFCLKYKDLLRNKLRINVLKIIFRFCNKIRKD